MINVIENIMLYEIITFSSFTNQFVFALGTAILGNVRR